MARHSDPAVSGTIKVGRETQGEIAQKREGQKDKGAISEPKFRNLEKCIDNVGDVGDVGHVGDFDLPKYDKYGTIEPSKKIKTQSSETFRDRFMIRVTLSRSGWDAIATVADAGGDAVASVTYEVHIKRGGQHGSTKQQLVDVWPIFLGVI